MLTNSTSSSFRFALRPLMVGTAGALAVSALWVGLTALTGKTYHLAPGVAAWAPGLTVRVMIADRIDDLSRRGRWKLGLIASALGLAAVGVGRSAIALAGIEPSATLFAHQPGGVSGEFALTAFVGALLGARRLIRAPKPRRQNVSI